MSYFEGRRELGEAAHKAIDRAANNLKKLASELQRSDINVGERQMILASLLEASGFKVEWGAGGLSQAFIAENHNWNSEDMRKGMRHGHVGFVAASSPPALADGIGWDRLDVVAAAASAIGLSATLTKMYGTVSLIAVPSVSDLPRLVEGGVFEHPDCLFFMRADASGHGYQHTINNTGDHLARLTIDVSLSEGSAQFVHELQAAVESIIDEIEAPDSINPTATGFVIEARTAATINSGADRIAALARARAGSSATEITIERSALMPEFQPSRILARRIKTFNDTYKFPQDRIMKEPPGEPTLWGAISQIAATTKVRFPVSGEGSEINGDDIEQARNIAKATAGAGLDVLGDMEFRGFVEGEMIRGLRERGITRTPRRWLGVHPVIPRQNSQNVQSKQANYPDVIVRGPGLPDPLSREEPNDDQS